MTNRFTVIGGRQAFETTFIYKRPSDGKSPLARQHWLSHNKSLPEAAVDSVSRDSKADKARGNPKSYRPISPLWVPYKIFERLSYARVKPIIDPLVLKEQAGFVHGKSAVDQVVLLTESIEGF